MVLDTFYHHLCYAVKVHQPLDAVPNGIHHGHDNLGVRLDDHHDNNDHPGAGSSLPHHLHCLHHHCHRCRPQRCSPCHCHLDEMSEMSPKNVILTWKITFSPEKCHCHLKMSLSLTRNTIITYDRSLSPKNVIVTWKVSLSPKSVINT